MHQLSVASSSCIDVADCCLCVCRGQVRVVHGHEATGLQLVQSYSDSDEDSDGAWDGRLGDRYNPPGNLLPALCEPLRFLASIVSLYKISCPLFQNYFIYYQHKIMLAPV